MEGEGVGERGAAGPLGDGQRAQGNAQKGKRAKGQKGKRAKGQKGKRAKGMANVAAAGPLGKGAKGLALERGQRPRAPQEGAGASGAGGRPGRPQKRGFGLGRGPYLIISFPEPPLKAHFVPPAARGAKFGLLWSAFWAGRPRLRPGWASRHRRPRGRAPSRPLCQRVGLEPTIETEPMASAPPGARLAGLGSVWRGSPGRGPGRGPR
jgi:hypothetical protein